MAQQPHPAPKPSAPPPKPPAPPPLKPPETAKPRHAPGEDAPPLPIGAKPLNDEDPQAVKFDPPQPAPPTWSDPGQGPEPTPEHPIYIPEPAIDPRAAKPPAGAYADGMDIATEQRARAAWVEANGLEKYDEAVDQRPQADKPRFDPHALAGGGAFVSAGPQRQVPGTAPVTKRP